MAPPTLDGLPAEMQLAVVRFVDRPTELKALCLTCSALRTAALPKLYEDVDIDLDKCKMLGLNGFFSAANPGRAYTKRLTFGPDGPKDAAAAWQTMTMALHYLPRDVLSSLTLPERLMMEPPFLLTLSANQRYLTKLSAGLVGSALHNATACPAFYWDWLQNITAIRLPYLIKGDSDLTGHHQMMRHAPQLSDLRILAWQTISDKRIDNLLHDKATRDGLIFQTLFGHIHPAGGGSPLQLQELRLAGQTLNYADRTIQNAVDFSSLSRLHMSRCLGGGHLLRNLAAQFVKGPSVLVSFTYLGMPLLPSTIEPFLKSFSGLKTLQIRYCGSPNPATQHFNFDLACLHRHGNSLKTVVLTTATTHQWWTSSEVRVLCQTCWKLEEVALMLPKAPLDEHVGMGGAGLGLALAELANLKHLRVLKVCNWPVIRAAQVLATTSTDALGMARVDYSSKIDREFNRQRILTRMETLANKVLQKFIRISRGGLTELPILCFGAHTWCSPWVLDEKLRKVLWMQPLYYIPSRRIDLYGEVSVEVKSIKHADLKYLGGRGGLRSIVDAA